MVSSTGIGRFDPWGRSGTIIALPVRDVQRAGFHLAGIGSAADAVHVERLLRARPGILDIILSPITEIAYVTFDPARIDPDRILRALDATGHGPASRWRP